MKRYVIAALTLMSAADVFGAGYQLNLQGVRQMATGGAGTAWPWDASTIFYNPGGLGRLKSIQGYASLGLYMPSTAYGSSMSTARTHPQTFAPFNIYFGGPIQEDSKFALGLGVYSTSHIGAEWDDDWQGSHMVRSIRFKATMFQPTISYRLGDFMSVGAGFVYGAGTFDMNYALPYHGMLGPQSNLGDNGEANLHANANGVGFNLGIQMRPSDNLQFGLTYRSQVVMNIVGGRASFTTPLSLQGDYPNTSFDSYLPLPQVASFGMGVRASERLTLLLDLNYTGWKSHDSMRINFEQHTDRLQNMHTPRHYKNTLTARIGGNYKISKVVSAMLGGYYDPTPVTKGYVSPDMPDADRVALTAGLAIKPMPRFTILAGFEGMTSVKRTASYDYGGFSGTYKTQSATTSLAVYYNF